MQDAESRSGTIYTETIIHSPPEQYASDAPYQLAIIDLDRGGRLTVRVLGKEPHERASIGDRVMFVEERDGVAYYRKATALSAETESETPRPLV
jgi:uncharacterized OB-fold protein